MRRTTPAAAAVQPRRLRLDAVQYRPQSVVSSVGGGWFDLAAPLRSPLLSSGGSSTQPVHPQSGTRAWWQKRRERGFIPTLSSSAHGEDAALWADCGRLSVATQRRISRRLVQATAWQQQQQQQQQR
jgi:hypothetical protein